MMQSVSVLRLKPYRVAIALIIVLMTFVAAAAGYLFWNNYQDARTQAESRAASASQVVSANAIWAFETARQVLRRTDDTLGNDLSDPVPDAASRIADAISTMPGSVKVYVVDAAGVTRLTTDPDFKPIDVRDREYFSAVQKGKPWHISSLLVSRLNGEQIFTISKRIERQGLFAGAAILSFNSDLMEGVWNSLGLDLQSTVGLTSADGQLVSRFPLPDGPLNIGSSVLFTEYLPKSPSGIYQTISAADGVTRIVGYKRIPGTDLVAFSSISTEAAYESFWSAVKVALAIAIPSALALLLAALSTVRLLIRDARKRESDAQFRTVAEAMPNHVWTSQPNGRLDWFNSRVYEYSGESAGMLDGNAWTSIVHPDDIEEATRRWADAIYSAKPYEAELRILRADGSYRWHITRAVPIRDAKGRPTRWIGTNTDIDDQKQISQQLAESESRLRFAMDAGQLAVWELDVGQMRITPSPSLNRLYGFPEEAHPSLEDYQARYAPGELERVTALSKAFSERGEKELEVEIRHIWPDGTRRWLLVRAQTVTSADGKGERAIGVAIDVTARKKIERDLERSERRFRLSQQAAGLGSLELDIATGTVLGSDTFWDIWGLSRRDSVHISILENIVLAEDKDIRSTPETRTAGSAVPNVEYRIRRPDNGEIRWLSRHIEFVHDENGKPVKMFGIVQDITEQKEARSRQEMLMHELEHRIKNILAMVTAIATQTLKDGDLETVRKNFADRLRALASAHDILNKTRWTAASMAEVIEASIAPLPVARITTRGPDIALQPNMALSMALCLHELGTNALKYGALSVADGRVEINWEIRAGEVGDHETLVWTWSETGGPRVGKPTRKGFGSQLISRVLAADFSGDVEIDYRPSGLQVVLTAPFARQTQ